MNVQYKLYLQLHGISLLVFYLCYHGICVVCVCLLRDREKKSSFIPKSLSATLPRSPKITIKATAASEQQKTTKSMETNVNIKHF